MLEFLDPVTAFEAGLVSRGCIMTTDINTTDDINYRLINSGLYRNGHLLCKFKVNPIGLSLVFKGDRLSSHCYKWYLEVLCNNGFKYVFGPLEFDRTNETSYYREPCLDLKNFTERWWFNSDNVPVID